ncbi:MAG: MASE1 domain-containing protein [Xanthobacteraceae bacterium]
MTEDMAGSRSGSRFREAASYGLELCLIGIGYFVLAKLGLALASINPSTSPIWAPTGLALGAVLVRGYRVWPAILIAAFVANATTAGSLATSLAIAIGNTFEGLFGAYLINRWSAGKDTYESPAGVLRCAFICFLPTALCATIGAWALILGGLATWSNIGSIWLTWWLGDLAGALVVTPVVVLWARSYLESIDRRELPQTILTFAVSGIVGLIAFSPLFDPTDRQAPLGFLAILPLLWSALRRRQRDTATVALILSCFAVWGTLTGGGPFWRDSINESFLLLLMFMMGVAVPCLALSADVAVRQRTEEELLRIHDELNQRVERRTAALSTANHALQEEVERRKQVEAALDRQTKHLLEAQRLAKLGSWDRDIDRNTVVWSEQMYEVFGVARGQELAATFDGYLRRVHPDDRDRVRDEVQQAIRAGDGFHGERRIVRPNGEIRHLQTRVEVIRNEAGRAVRMHGICLDVTDRRQAELALERTREQLAQVQKMEAIGQLTGGIAHDFNNLLMIISGHTEMLRRRLNDPRAIHGLDAVQTAARRGESLTRQLLTFSRRQPLNPISVDLRQRLEAVREMLASSLRGNITLVVDIPEDLWPVEVDIAEFELAVVNIAVNARDAMPDGGTFTVSARNVSAGAGRAGEPSGDHVELSFADTGIGIGPDMIRKIFDPFFTTKAVGKGTGLGLSQVYGFANQSGGNVSVTSEVGRGTTIALYLPRNEATVEAIIAPAIPQGTIPADGTILVVEDNPEVADVTATLLEQLGYQVARAGNAVEALARLQNGDRFDLLFSDIVMPHGMNGIHLAQEVSEHYPGMHVLLTTGYSDVAGAAESRFPILRKPFELSALDRAVREAMAGSVGGGRRAIRGVAS